MMARVNGLLESWIVARPYEWQCFQNRWPKSTRLKTLKAKALGRAESGAPSGIRPTVGERLRRREATCAAELGPSVPGRRQAL
jgi:hypothetical protein